MTRLDHHQFDLAVFKGSRRKSVACHLFDDRPMCQKVFLRLYLGREPGLQNAALPRVSIRYLKSYRLRSLVDLLFGGLGEFRHRLILHETLIKLGYRARLQLPRRRPFRASRYDRRATARADLSWPSARVSACGPRWV